MPEASTHSTEKASIEPTRRQFAAMGAIATTVMGWSGTAAAAAPSAVIEQSVKIPAQRGQIAGKMFKPEVGAQPGLVMFASAAASPAANAAVARQLAEQGWSVLLVDAPIGANPETINRDARALVAWLKAQSGVAGAEQPGSKDGYRLQSIVAAYPKMSLASRAECRAASCSAVLFAVPEGQAAKTEARTESLTGAARALHRLAA